MPSYRALPHRALLPAARAAASAAAVTALAIGVTAAVVPSADAAPSAGAVSSAGAVPPAGTVRSAGPATAGWRPVPPPAVGADTSANLTALAMASPSLGWAAGFTLANANANAPFEPLLAAWNGHRWRPVRLSLGQTDGARLDGLAAASPTDAWAVGSVAPNADSSLPLFLHWNGRQWARVPGAAVPGFGYARLLAVAVRSGTDAWAVGEAQSATKPALRPVIEHWNGRRWQLMANPPVPAMTALSGVTVAADGEAWAVGTPFFDTGRGVILHWTGRAWVTATTPKTGGSVFLNGVTSVGPGNVWAVGSASADGGPYLPYALHWTGRRWTAVAVPHPGEGNESWEFESVTSIGHGHLAAVGSAGSAAIGRALYGAWNGRRWSLSTGPGITQLNAASFDGRAAIWAVGSETTSSQTFRPVVEVNG